MTEPGRDRGRRRRNGLFRWHRWAGVGAAAFLLLLLVTGVPLQMSAPLDLGNRHVRADWVLDWYGLQAPVDVRVSGSLAAVGERLFSDGRPVANLTGFNGAIALHGLTAAAGDHEVLLLDTAAASEIDRFRFDSPVRRIGRLSDTLAVETGNGIRVADADLVNWLPAALDPAAVEWHTASPADPAVAAPLRHRYRQGMLSVERLLQDLHSGRFLGTPGVVLMDAASVLLGFLAISGLIMWWRTPR